MKARHEIKLPMTCKVEVDSDGAPHERTMRISAELVNGEEWVRLYYEDYYYGDTIEVDIFTAKTVDFHTFLDEYQLTTL